MRKTTKLIALFMLCLAWGVGWGQKWEERDFPIQQGDSIINLVQNKKTGEVLRIYKNYKYDRSVDFRPVDVECGFYHEDGTRTPTGKDEVILFNDKTLTTYYTQWNVPEATLIKAFSYEDRVLKKIKMRHYPIMHMPFKVLNDTLILLTDEHEGFGTSTGIFTNKLEYFKSFAPPGGFSMETTAAGKDKIVSIVKDYKSDSSFIYVIDKNGEFVSNRKFFSMDFTVNEMYAGEGAFVIAGFKYNFSNPNMTSFHTRIIDYEGRTILENNGAWLCGFYSHGGTPVFFNQDIVFSERVLFKGSRQDLTMQKYHSKSQKLEILKVDEYIASDLAIVPGLSLDNSSACDIIGRMPLNNEIEKEFHSFLMKPKLRVYSIDSPNIQEIDGPDSIIIDKGGSFDFIGASKILVKKVNGNLTIITPLKIYSYEK